MRKLNNLLTFKNFTGSLPTNDQKKTKRTDVGLDILKESNREKYEDWGNEDGSEDWEIYCEDGDFFIEELTEDEVDLLDKQNLLYWNDDTGLGTSLMFLFKEKDLPKMEKVLGRKLK